MISYFVNCVFVFHLLCFFYELVGVGRTACWEFTECMENPLYMPIDPCGIDVIWAFDSQVMWFLFQQPIHSYNLPSLTLTLWRNHPAGLHQPVGMTKPFEISRIFEEQMKWRVRPSSTKWLKSMLPFKTSARLVRAPHWRKFSLEKETWSAFVSPSWQNSIKWVGRTRLRFSHQFVASCKVGELLSHLTILDRL